MKKLSLLTVVVFLITACSTTKHSPVNDTTMTTSFNEEGIKLYYTSSGNLEKIESYGTASKRQDNYRVAAELDAKDKLIKFVRGETVDSNHIMKSVAKTMHESKTNTPDEDSTDSLALKTAASVASHISVRAAGQLRSVYKERGFDANTDTYVAVWVWSPNQHKTARNIVLTMDQ